MGKGKGTRLSHLKEKRIAVEGEVEKPSFTEFLEGPSFALT